MGGGGWRALGRNWWSVANLVGDAGLTSCVSYTSCTCKGCIHQYMHVWSYLIAVLTAAAGPAAAAGLHALARHVLVIHIPDLRDITLRFP